MQGFPHVACVSENVAENIIMPAKVSLAGKLLLGDSTVGLPTQSAWVASSISEKIKHSNVCLVAINAKMIANNAFALIF